MQDFYDSIKHLAAGQVYAIVAPANAQYPTLVYTPIDQSNVASLDGPNQLRRSRVQVDAYARTLVACEQLQEQVLAALLSSIKTVADVRMGLTDFDDESGTYRISVDFTYYR
jgi:hypothetical protein